MSAHKSVRCLAFLGFLVFMFISHEAVGVDWSTDQEKAYRQFLNEYDNGSDCPRLFDLRKKFRHPFKATPQEQEANTKLRSVGCFSAQSKRKMQTTNDASFTIREYKMYRAIIGTPLSVSESEAYSRVAKRYGITPQKSMEATERVQRILYTNNWFGSPDSEIRHASDWLGK